MSKTCKRPLSGLGVLTLCMEGILVLTLVGGVQPHLKAMPVGAASVADAQTTAEWPMAAANPQRTSWTPEEVRGKMYPLWAVSIEPFIPFANQVIAAYDTVYISTARGLYALNAGTGGLRWVFPTEMPLGNVPTIADGVAYVGGYDHRLYALNAYTGQLLWSYEAGKGFSTNPLVVEGMVILGNRDGYLYAVNTDGTLAWRFKTDGPILFSAAYKDGVVYFAANDSYAYAVWTDGTLKWKSAKLPGGGFYTFWPVIYTTSGHDYVVLGGNNDYRRGSELAVGALNNELDRDALYYDIPEGGLVGPTGTEPGDWAPGTVTINDDRAVQYLEARPDRRRVFVLDAATGHEYTFDSDGDGNPEYAPITWYGTHGGNRYPSIIGGDGVLVQGNSYVSNPYIPRGGPAGWKFGSQYISRVHEGNYGAVDEPMAVSAGGNLIYWGWFSGGCGMGAYDITLPYGMPGRKWTYWDLGSPGYLEDTCPGAGAMYAQGPPDSPGSYYTAGGDYGIYRTHGNVNPPVPYKGKLYFHVGNTVFAVSSTQSTCQCTSLPIFSSDSAPVSVDSNSLRRTLASEIEKIIQAGHLRPGYYHGTLGTYHLDKGYNSYLTDYFHNPAQTFITLIDALPHLSPDLQSQLRTYLQNEWAGYGNAVHIGWRDGAAREVFSIPPDIQARMGDFGPQTGIYGLTWDYRYSLYGRWKYIQEFDDQNHSLAIQVFDQIRGGVEIRPPEQEATWTNVVLYNPYIKNAYIAGYLGYIGIGKLAGYSETGTVLSPYVAELNRLLAERASEFSKDQPTPLKAANALTLARNFMYLVPELAEYLRANAYTKVQEALNEYDQVGSYWFVSKYDATSGEGVLQPIYDYSALFQAKALILQEPQEELVKYLDVPAFARGDLFYIQNLIAAIEAPQILEKTASLTSGGQGTAKTYTITYTLGFFGTGNTLSLTDTLPAGVSAPVAFELEGTNVIPSYNSDHHRLTWSDTPTAGQKVAIRYTVAITTGESQALVNDAELKGVGSEPSVAQTTVIVNPYPIHLPLILKVH
jgi:outer membrane protein assembly factor BamB